QHGDDHFHITTGQRGNAGRSAGAGLYQVGNGGLGQIEYGQLMAGLDEVVGHGAAHVAEAEESDFHMSYLLFLSASCIDAQACLKLGLRFSANACMPSVRSAVAKIEWNTRRSKRTPSLRLLSNTRLTHSLVIITLGRDLLAMTWAVFRVSSNS